MWLEVCSQLLCLKVPLHPPETYPYLWKTHVLVKEGKEEQMGSAMQGRDANGW